jgi:hypothetical protein
LWNIVLSTHSFIINLFQSEIILLKVTSISECLSISDIDAGLETASSAIPAIPDFHSACPK